MTRIIHSQAVVVNDRPPTCTNGFVITGSSLNHSVKASNFSKRGGKMSKKSKNGQILEKAVLEAFEENPDLNIIGLSVEKIQKNFYLKAVRSAQRLVREFQHSDKYVYSRRQDGVQLLLRPGVPEYDASMYFVETESKGALIFYRVSEEAPEPAADDEEWSPIKSNGTSGSTVIVPLNEDANQNGWQELFAMVCSVCGRSALLIQDSERKLVDLLFRAEVKPDELYKHYHMNTRPNFWQFDWRSKRGVKPPTISNLLETIDQARIWIPSYVDTLPGYLKIVEDFEKIQKDVSRMDGKSGFVTLKALGYGPLFDKIGYKWWDLKRNTIEKNRQLIRNALFELREQEKQALLNKQTKQLV